MYYNKDVRNKNLTPITNDLDKNTTCCAIGSNEYANSNITLTAGSRVFHLKVCQNCKRIIILLIRNINNLTFLIKF
jgi:hypothetical protein